MGFATLLPDHRQASRPETFRHVTTRMVERALTTESPTALDLLTLLSPAAEPFLETMARMARDATVKHFGRVIQLFTPMYVSDHCDNQCSYCGYSARMRFARRTLELSEVRREADLIAATGLRHVLLLTGESRSKSPVSYLRDCVDILKARFRGVSLEVYPLEEADYAALVDAGADGLTVYQETYDEEVYARMHPFGPKRDYHFRLDTPERGARAGLRRVGIGALHGLADWRQEAYLTAMHVRYLQGLFPDLELSVSFPRLQPYGGHLEGVNTVRDRHFVQMILAFRLFLPWVGITLSTRESSTLRDHLVPLGITRLSAGVSTQVGGRLGSSDEGAPQFEIADSRSVEAILAMLRAKGYDPVLSDWLPDLQSPARSTMRPPVIPANWSSVVGTPVASVPAAG